MFVEKNMMKTDLYDVELERKSSRMHQLEINV